MSEKTKYVTVQCRVPAGLLKDGETLEWRTCPDEHDCLSGTPLSGMRVNSKWIPHAANSRMLVIIPPFDANAWAAKNLQKPACERELWAAMDSNGDWYTAFTEPELRTKSWRMPEWRSVSDHMLGPDEFKLSWQQSKYKWCRVDGEWRWLWQGGNQ